MPRLTRRLAALVVVTAAGCSSSGGNKFVAFCAKGTNLTANVNQLNPRDANDVGKLEHALAALEASAPAEIKADLEALDGGIKAMQQALANPTQAAAIAKRIDGARMTAAGNAIQQWVKDHC